MVDLLALYIVVAKFLVDRLAGTDIENFKGVS